jgi:hypothetical protein
MDEIDPQAKEGMQFVFCESVEDILSAVLIGYGEKPLPAKKEAAKETIIPQAMLNTPAANTAVGAATV